MTLHQNSDKKALTHPGSKLFLRCISGKQVVTKVETKCVNSHNFIEWGGAHYDSYPAPYLTAFASIGMIDADIERFLNRARNAASWARRCRRPELRSVRTGTPTARASWTPPPFLWGYVPFQRTWGRRSICCSVRRRQQRLGLLCPPSNRSPAPIAGPFTRQFRLELIDGALSYLSCLPTDGVP